MLELQDVGYSYTSVGGARGDASSILDGVSLSLRRGERVAVVGPNGSGKSTLLRCAAMQLNPTRGCIVLDGRALANAEDVQRLRTRVGIVAQDPDDQIVASTVFEEVAFGPCNLGLPPYEIHASVKDALRVCDLQGFEDRDVVSLSGGQRQRLALAGVLAMRPDYILLDEPCSMLDLEARVRVRSAIESVARDGTGVVCVTHELAEIIDYDRLIVMERGRIVWEGKPAELLMDEDFLGRSHCLLSPWLECARILVGEGLLRLDAPLTDPEACGDLVAHAGRASLDRARCVADGICNDIGLWGDAQASAGPLTGGLCGQNLWVNYGGGSSWAIKAVAACVKHGEVLLVTGRTGSGKSTLAYALAGLLTPEQGRVSVDGSPVRPGLIGYAFQRAEDQLFADTVIDDVAFGPRNMGKSSAQAVEDACAALRLVRLDPQSYGSVHPFALSGGQMRRVALAGVLAMNTPYVVFDEPTVGLDAEGFGELAAVIRSLVDKDVGVVMVSHDMEWAASLASHILLLEGGEVRWRGTASEYLRQGVFDGCAFGGRSGLAKFLRGLHGAR